MVESDLSLWGLWDARKKQNTKNEQITLYKVASYFMLQRFPQKASGRMNSHSKIIKPIRKQQQQKNQAVDDRLHQSVQGIQKTG